MTRFPLQALLTSMIFLFQAGMLSAQKEHTVLSVPGHAAYTHIDINGNTVLPSGRYLTPAGKNIQITHDPFGMAVSRDGRKTVTLHNGVFTVIDNTSLQTIRVPSYDDKIISPLSNGSFLGVAFGKTDDIVFIYLFLITFKKLYS